MKRAPFRTTTCLVVIVTAIGLVDLMRKLTK